MSSSPGSKCLSSCFWICCVHLPLCSTPAEVASRLRQEHRSMATICARLSFPLKSSQLLMEYRERSPEKALCCPGPLVASGYRVHRVSCKAKRRSCPGRMEGTQVHQVLQAGLCVVVQGQGLETPDSCLQTALPLTSWTDFGQVTKPC